MVNELKNVGLKSTEARSAVLKILRNESTPLDISEILHKLKKSNVNADQATIYRIINVFFDKGIIKRIEIGEGKYRYEIAADDHHHLICVKCGDMQNIEDKFMKEIEKEINQKKGFRVKSHSLEFFGLCQNCQS